MEEDEEIKKDNNKTLGVDFEYYETFLKDSDASDEQKRELIEALWTIMVSFVDLGFEIDPSSHAVKLAKEKPPARRTHKTLEKGEHCQEEGAAI